MHIQIWSDFACPFCYIGKYNLERAIGRLSPENQAKIQLSFRSFELNPEAPNYTDKSVVEELAEKYGTTKEKTKRLVGNITKAGEDAGLKFDFKKVKPTNTFKAHQLLHYTMANEPKKTIEISHQLFIAYFSEGENLADDETLIKIAERVGLNVNEFSKALKSENYANHVRDDEKIAHQINISSVPFFVINNKSAISGSQSVEDFYQYLEEILEEESPTLH